MSVQIFFGKDKLKACEEEDKLCGLCFLPLHQTGEAYGEKTCKDTRNILIDLGKHPPLDELNSDNPIEIALNFGSVPVESKNISEISIHDSKNARAPLPTEFSVERREELREQYDKVFHVLLPEHSNVIPLLSTATQGILGCAQKNKKGVSNRGLADTQFKFRILFKPTFPGMSYTTTLMIWLGKYPIKLRCHGFCEGPLICFSQNRINFGGHYYGMETMIKVTMFNRSIAEASFQFDTDNARSVFKICPSSGIIPAYGTTTLNIFFRPHKPQTFYKRAYCLIHMQCPQYLDLIGVCIPRPFFAEKTIDFCVSAANTHFLPVPTPSFDEYFTRDLWGVNLSQENFNFGRKTLRFIDVDNKLGSLPSREAETSTLHLTLTSVLPYDVIIEWVPDPLGVFTVCPMSAFLNANLWVTFELGFDPGLPDTFYSGQLECYVYPTTYIWPTKAGPPWKCIKNCMPPSAAPSAAVIHFNKTMGSSPAPSTTTMPDAAEIIDQTPVPSTAAENEDQDKSAENIDQEGISAEIAAVMNGTESNATTISEQDPVPTELPASGIEFPTGQLPQRTRANSKSTSRSRVKGKKRKARNPASNVKLALSTAPVYYPIHGRIPFEITIQNSASCTKHRIIALKHLINTDPDNPEILRDYVTECNPPTVTSAAAEDSMEANVFPTPSTFPTLEDIIVTDSVKSDAEVVASDPVPAPVSKTPSPPLDEVVVAPDQESSVPESASEPEQPKKKKKKSKASVDDASDFSTQKKKKKKSKSDSIEAPAPLPLPTSTPPTIPNPGAADGEDSVSKETKEPLPYLQILPVTLTPTPSAETSVSRSRSKRRQVGGANASILSNATTAISVSKTKDDFGGGDSENWSTVDVDPALLEKREGSFRVPDSRGGGDSGNLGPTELAVPLCLTVRLTGHTYCAVSEPPVPNFSLPARVTMNPTLPQQRETRTFVMKNHSDIPLLFDVQDLDESGVYTPKPTIGVIAGNHQQILTMSMNTTEPESAAYEHNFKVNINVIDHNQLSISGYAEVPALILTLLSDPTGDVNEINCPTTIPGFCTNAYFTMKNPSRFHYRYSFEFADDDEELLPVFTPSPSKGILAPYDCVKVTWKFVPYQYKSYRTPWKFRFEVMGGKTEGSYWNAVYEFCIPLQGTGRQCHLNALPKVLEFDQIRIYESITKWFTVTNDGPSAFVARLVPRHEQWLEWYDSQELIISPTVITLQPGESIEIKTTVRPEKLVMYDFRIDYEPVAGEKDSNGYAIAAAHKLNGLLNVTFMGNHAVAMVTDILQISRHQSWDSEQSWGMFSIDELNRLLTPLKYAAREGTLPKVPTVQFNFPNAPVGSPPVVFTLLLTSISDSILCWRIHTLPPKNSKYHEMKNRNTRQSFSGSSVPEENESFLTALWAEKYGQIYQHLKHESLRLTALKNTDQFRVTPMQNMLSPRKQMIHFKFFYEHPGYHKIPVLLRIYPAIFVWLELNCRVLQGGEPSLQPMHNKEMIFHPISLSDLSPPIQSFWLYNGSTVASTFKVDMEPFKRVKGRNFGHCCIECLTPDGVVLPKSWGPVKLRFSPLEYCTYDTHLRMSFNNSENWTQVELKGQASMTENLDLRPKAPTHPSEIVTAFVPISLRPRKVIIPHYIPTGERASSCSFSWPEVTYVNSTSIKFLPDYGTLAPKEQLACQVVIQAGDVNHIMSTHIRCWIEDWTAMQQFNRQSKLWRGELVEYENVQVVTKKEGPHIVHRQSVHHQPLRPDSFSQLLTISCYVGSVFGTLDDIWSPELCKMPFSDPVGIQPLPGGEGRKLALSPLNRHLTQEVITQILWDMILLSPNWPSYMRAVSKRQAVYFDDYKRSEQVSEIPGDTYPLYTLPQKIKEDVMEFVTFTMLQEMTDRFATGEQDWPALAPSDLR